jgi:hypothetical protein
MMSLSRLVTPDLIDACRAAYPVGLGRYDLVFVGVQIDDGVVGATLRMITWDEAFLAIEGIVEQRVALFRLPDEVAPGVVRIAGLRLAVGDDVTRARIARHCTALAHQAPARFAAALAAGAAPEPAAALIERG